MSNQTQAPPLDPNSISTEFPNCAIPCLDEQQFGNCGEVDLSCVCQDIYWLAGSLVCLGQTCNSSESATVESLFPKWCNTAIALEALLLASESAAQASATAPLSPGVESMKPESLAGILFGSITGGFLVLFAVAFLLWKRVRGISMKHSRRNGQVDVTKVKGGGSGLEEQAASSSPYLVRLPDQPPAPPIPSNSSHRTQAVSEKRAEMMSISDDNNQHLDEARPSRALEMPVSPAPSQVPPPSYHGESP